MAMYQRRKLCDAEGYFRQVVDGRQQVYGEQHPATLTSRHWLALTLYATGNYADAQHWFEQVVVGRQKQYSDDHKSTVTSRFWMAKTSYELEEYGKAQVLLRQVVKARQNMCGDTHEDTQDSIFWLAKTMFELQQWKYPLPQTQRKKYPYTNFQAMSDLSKPARPSSSIRLVPGSTPLSPSYQR
ncbi:hypothetical protein O9K51_10788 [Purpureocillium lavendulum]|uniref:Kinesin light chain n=1 Tax=Purpureocillium lavendulum TaxID=1247861 RepID=A0AB34FDD6_9HYPO|nr:hypothetical protein O9K51_10788 [Purpureocillium lavendulum]